MYALFYIISNFIYLKLITFKLKNIFLSSLFLNMILNNKNLLLLLSNRLNTHKNTNNVPTKRLVNEYNNIGYILKCNIVFTSHCYKGKMLICIEVSYIYIYIYIYILYMYIIIIIMYRWITA